jgi:hypothetical protein
MLAAMSARGRAPRWRDDRGQAALLVLGALLALCAGGVLLGVLASGVGRRDDAARAADLGALAGARAMHAVYGRLFEPAVVDGVANPRHLEKVAYLARGRAAAAAVVARNGGGAVAVGFPDGGSFAPTQVRVRVERALRVLGRRVAVGASATAQLGAGPVDASATAYGGGYAGPLAYRQGTPMRPDVALGFDRMAAAAARDGIVLTISSGFRSDAEQQVLWDAHPDPKWVARPGTSLHRNGTELDLGPASAYPWLAANAARFHFTVRYGWEPWHLGWTLNAASALAAGGDGEAGGARSLPDFVPERFRAPIAAAAQRWNVAGNLLAAQLLAESGFNPFAVSPAGAQGIAQFMPGTARGYGLANPFDPAAAIDAQAHLMRDLLRQFGSVPLALAAYNAGGRRVAACGCVPPIAETQGYVARILGLMGGAGEAVAGGGLVVRLIA